MSESSSGRRVLYQDVVLAVAVIVFGVLAFVNALRMPQNANLFPIIVTGLLTILGLALLLITLRNIRSQFRAAKQENAFVAPSSLRSYAWLCSAN